MPDKTASPAELKHRKLTLGKISNQPISDLFGSVNEVPNIQIAQSYHTEFEHCIKFVKCDDNLAFMGTSWGNVFAKSNIRKDRIQCELEITLSVFDMAMMNNGDLLVSSDKTDLQLYTTDNQAKTFGTVPPLHTLGVHVNKQNEIYLGLSEWPRRICTNNKYIFVVDLLHNGPGRVVVIDKGGQLQWNYNGSFDKFYPRDIAVSSTEMVIVTDCINNALLILSPNGEIILCKIVSELGIYFPYSLIIGDDKKLWIGTWDSKERSML
ncbi:unnamed protein product [Mytilus coruscus]|uniref:TRIM2_3 n=1 Tax=Mytilus coruscus TaxID=42192 RepID=A0A6J8E4L9_MYTCO|nr:unnamed protein product [Mytilus coruscus]